MTPAPATGGRRRIGRGVAVLAGLLCLLGLPPALAATPTPAPPTAVRVTAVSASSFTVTARAAAYARAYRLYVSTAKSDVYVANIRAGHTSSARRTATAASPVLSVTGLRYTTALYYFRVAALNGTAQRFSDPIGSVSLRPATPTNVRAFSSAAGTFLTWSSATATGFGIAQATNAAMTGQRRNYTVRGSGHQFTPYRLAKGATYYFRIRALNGATGSYYSALVHAVAESRGQPVRVMTYNILHAALDGTIEGGQRIAAWSLRRIVAARLITGSNADVVSIQEGASWVGAVRGPRQIDSLSAALGGTYALARTEIPPSEPYYFRTSNYILYRTSAYRTVGQGGHWAIGAHWAAYQILQHRSTGARFLFVAPHLAVGAGAANDARRQAETASMVRQAQSLAAAARVPVVYAGDFNSDTARAIHAFDGPGIAMRAAHVADTRQVALARSNERYDSANQYLRTPPAYWQSIDYVFVSPGVAVYSWRLILSLSHGKFVGPMASDHNPVYANVVIPY